MVDLVTSGIRAYGYRQSSISNGRQGVAWEEIGFRYTTHTVAHRITLPLDARATSTCLLREPAPDRAFLPDLRLYRTLGVYVLLPYLQIAPAGLEVPAANHHQRPDPRPAVKPQHSSEWKRDVKWWAKWGVARRRSSAAAVSRV